MTQRLTTQTPRRMAMIVLLLGLASPAQAELYRWVDDSGQVHYSDKKPNNNEQPTGVAETLDFAPGTAAAKARRDRAEAEARENERIAERCGAARAQLEAYRRAVSLVRQGPDGAEVELSSSEREALIEQSQAKVDAACQEPAT